MRHRLLLGLTGLVLLPLAACGPGDPSLDAARAGIVSGTPSDHDGAVAAVLVGSSVVCSATLVADRILLTAAHCLEGAPDRVFFGEGTHLGGTFVDVELSREHPEYRSGRIERDIGAILLAEDAPADVARLALLEEPLDDGWVTRPIRIVGFGDPGATATVVATRREGSTMITQIDEHSLYHEASPSLACFGDSGGPALAEVEGVETVVGIATAGDDRCEEYGVHARIDVNLAFVQSFPDPGVAPGGRCRADYSCTTGRCIPPLSTGGFSYCSSYCATTADCAGAMTCRVDEAGERLCRHADPPPGGLGSACGASTECASDLCIAPDDGGEVCALRCFADNAIACPPGFACLPSRSGVDSDGEACFHVPPRADSPGACSVTLAPPRRSLTDLAPAALLAIAMVTSLGRGARRAHAGGGALAHDGKGRCAPPGLLGRCQLETGDGVARAVRSAARERAQNDASIPTLGMVTGPRSR